MNRQTTDTRRQTTHPHRRSRQERAAALHARNLNITPQQQLEILDDRLGVGVGAVRERAKLQRLIEAVPEKKKQKK